VIIYINLTLVGFLGEPNAVKPLFVYPEGKPEGALAPLKTNLPLPLDKGQGIQGIGLPIMKLGEILEKGPGEIDCWTIVIEGIDKSRTA